MSEPYGLEEFFGSFFSVSIFFYLKYFEIPANKSN